MEKPFNLVVEDFKSELTALINNSGLPIGMVRYIMADYLNMLNAQYQEVLKQEKEAFDKTKASTEEVKAE